MLLSLLYAQQVFFLELKWLFFKRLYALYSFEVKKILGLSPFLRRAGLPGAFFDYLGQRNGLLRAENIPLEVSQNAREQSRYENLSRLFQALRVRVIV